MLLFHELSLKRNSFPKNREITRVQRGQKKNLNATSESILPQCEDVTLLCQPAKRHLIFTRLTQSPTVVNKIIKESNLSIENYSNFL